VSGFVPTSRYAVARLSVFIPEDHGSRESGNSQAAVHKTVWPVM
jgi:hypothetical protein